ncbi:hypothetical protein O6P37_09015 [Mycobacterium sp. CPCC 205372]|uniref:Uncharacterized protein n=1 Tax=Mycobacterium hippophais TaxID=3016340 RepID=A0ABT4PR94_9MYCO|nr:hypothetical protein [Mycobacterium hippophais]MCZ8378999.1 hypothetical protein [Mycobacterium hippophais]
MTTMSATTVAADSSIRRRGSRRSRAAAAMSAVTLLSPEAVHAMRYAAGFIGSALRSTQIDADTDTEKVG